MGFWQVQSRFTRGELDPKLTGQVELQSYYDGLSKARNVVTSPQGGIRKRNGFRYIDEVDNEGASSGRLENFSFNTEQQYLFVFSLSQLDVYENEILVDTQTQYDPGGGLVDLPWDTAAKIRDLDYIQSADTAIIVHPDFAPLIVTRAAGPVFIVTVMPLLNIPQVYFEDTPPGDLQVQSLTFTNFQEGDRFKVSLEGILTDEIAWAGGTLDQQLANSQSIKRALLELPNTPNSGITVACTATVCSVFFDDEAARDWEVMAGTPTYTNQSTAIIAGAVSGPDPGSDTREDVWSDNLGPVTMEIRGWPQTCTFHEGRLWFGGSLSKPQSIWGSIIGDFFNFQEGRGLDNQAVFATLDTDQVNSIRGIFSNRSLQIFTSGGEFFVPQRSEDPITPSNIAVLPQSRLGSKRIRPVTIEGITYFVQRTGKAINQFLFLDATKSNQANSISILASHLINDPTEIKASRGTDTEDANYVYIINPAGDMTVFNTMVTEDVTAFTNWSTQGEYKSTAIVDDRQYLLVERDINGTSKTYIELEDPTTNLDSAVFETVVAGVISNLSHLEDEAVAVKVDGVALEETYLVVSGQVTLDPGDPQSGTAEVGFIFHPQVKTMPFNTATQGGPTFTSKKHLYRVALDIEDSNSILVNGYTFPDPLDGAGPQLEPLNGIYRRFMRGWSTEAFVEITQLSPYDFQILSINVEVKN